MYADLGSYGLYERALRQLAGGVLEVPRDG
jgi:hypothetical protein